MQVQIIVNSCFGAQGSLHELLHRETKLNEEIAKEYTKQLLHAIEYLHSKNIIHRNIEPKSILISHEGTAKLCKSLKT